MPRAHLGAGIVLALAGCCLNEISGIATTGGSTGEGTTGSTSGTTGTGPRQCPPATYQTSPGPISLRNYAGAAFGSDGLAYIAGGAPEGGQTIDLVEVLNPDSGVVTTGPSMLSPHSSFAFLASADHRTLYAIGGYDAVGGTTSAESFDVATQTWTALPPLPVPAGPTVGALLADGRIVVILPNVLDADGGASVEVFEDGGWVPGPSVPTNSYGGQPVAAGAGIGEAVYSFDRWLQIRVWDPSADGGAWTQIFGAMNHDRIIDAAAAQGADELFIAGGVSLGVDCRSEVDGVQVFDFGNAAPTLSWSSGAPVGRDTAAAAISPDGRLFVFAGETTGVCCTGSTLSLSYTYLGSYDVLDLDSGVWEPTHGM